MAYEEQTVELRNDFYRDSFGQVIFIIVSIFLLIILLVSLSLYLYWNKPKPYVFPVGEEWRIQPSVPLDKSYLATADLLQWVTDAFANIFVLDFIHYKDQLDKISHYFTPDGWKIFLNQLNIYANYNNVQMNKLFINGSASEAPSIINQQILSGRYAWWVQVPVTLNYVGYNKSYSQNLTLQVLVVRVSTLNNLGGVAIDNVIVAEKS